MEHKTFDIAPALVALAPSDSLSGITDLSVSGAKPEGTRQIDKVRALVIEDQLIIGKDFPDGVEVVFQEQIKKIEKIEKQWHLLTSTGKIVAVAKDKNCACGTRLKSWNPYGSYVRLTQD